MDKARIEKLRNAAWGYCASMLEMRVEPSTVLALLDEIDRLRSAQDVERRIVEARIQGMREGLAESKRHFSHVAAESALEERISELRASLAKGGE